MEKRSPDPHARSCFVMIRVVYTVALLALSGSLLLLGCEAEPNEASSPDADTTLQGPTWSEAQEEGAATVRVPYVPADDFAYVDEDGYHTGITVELMRLFADWVETEHDVMLTLDFVEETDWRTFYSRVKQSEGGVFGLGNVTITEERRDELQFSPPYFNNMAVLISHEDVAELEHLDAWSTTFDGFTPLAFEGTLHEERLRNLVETHAPNTELAFSDANDDIIERVSTGEYVAYIDGYNYWRAVDEGARLRRHPVGDDPAETFGIIMPLNSDWGDPVEAFFTEEGDLRDRSVYRNLLADHLGESVTDALTEAID